MLGIFRKLAGTWPARVFFLLLAAAFVGWGVSGRVSGLGGGPGANDVATVNGTPISAGTFQSAFQLEWRRFSERLPDPNQAPPGLRPQLAQQVLSRLVTQQALADEAERLRIAVPDAAIRDQVFKTQAFQGRNGQFDRAVFLQVLQNNGYTESRYLDSVRRDLVQHQLLDPIGATFSPPETMAKLVYAYYAEARSADMVGVPFAKMRPPAPPTDAVLQRFYANNAQLFTAPEYRHIHAVILSPDTIGRTLPVSDAEMKTWYDAHRGEFESPEKRSLQVVTASDAAKAAALAAQWRTGAPWAAIETAAKQAGATTVTLDDSTREELPSPELAAAAFGAAAGAVVGPVQEPLGSQVVRVIKITPAKHADYAALHDTIRARVGAEKAADLIDARAQKLQDLFAGGSRIEEVPADLGAAGAAGTLDAQGRTPEGDKAPIPGSEALRTAVIEAAFKTAKGDQPQLVEGPEHGWYALTVDEITPPAKKPFAQVRAAVFAAWQKEQIRHEAETEAARILALVKGGQTLATAAWGSGLTVTRTPPLARNRPAAGVPTELVAQLFTLQPGEPAMVETNDGFTVATLAAITHPDPAQHGTDVATTAKELGRAASDYAMEIYANGVREASRTRLNPKVLSDLVAQ